jgi:hypothetical protein
MQAYSSLADIADMSKIAASAKPAPLACVADFPQEWRRRSIITGDGLDVGLIAAGVLAVLPFPAFSDRLNEGD